MSHHISRLKKNNKIYLDDNIKRRRKNSSFSSNKNINHESISLSKAIPQHEDYKSYSSNDVYGHGKLVLPPIWDSSKNHHHSIISLPSLTPSNQYNQYNHRSSKYDSKRNNQHNSQHVEDRKSLDPSSSSPLFPLKEEKERKKSKRKSNNNKKRRRTKKSSKLNNCKNEQKESNDCTDHNLIRQSQHEDKDSSTTSIIRNVNTHNTVDEYQSSLSPPSRRHDLHKDTHNDKPTKNITKKHDKKKIRKSKHDNQKDNDLPITTPKKLKEIHRSTEDSTIQKIILHNKTTYTTHTTTAAAILIQKIIRGKIARMYAYKLYRKDLFRQAAESGVLLACEGTEQGKSGWYQQCEKSTPLYYKVDRNGTWRLIT